MDMNVNATGNGSDMGELIRQIAELRAQNEALKAKATAAANRRLRLKVSDKGAISLYGMGKFPVTLYKQQWERVLEYGQEIRDFIVEHASELSTKE